MLKKIVSIMISCTLMLTAFPIATLSVAAASNTKTLYRYHRYVCSSGISVCGYYGEYKYGREMRLEYTDWLEEPLPVDNGKYSTYTHVRQSACKSHGCIDQSLDTNRFRDSQGQYWYYQETKKVTTSSGNSTSSSSSSNTSNKTESSIEVSTKPILVDKELSVWDEITNNLAGYAFDLVEATLEAFTPADSHKAIREIVQHKELLLYTIRSLQIQDVKKMACDERTKDLLVYIISNGTDIKLTQEELELIANDVYFYLDNRSEALQREVLKQVFGELPAQFLTVAGKKNPALMAIGIVWAPSIRAIMDCGFAVQDLNNAYGDYYSLIQLHWQDAQKQLEEMYTLTQQAAAKDGKSGKTEFRNSVKNLQNNSVNTVAVYTKAIQDLLDKPGFQFFHRKESTALKDLLKEVEKLGKIDLVEIYDEVRLA